MSRATSLPGCSLKSLVALIVIFFLAAVLFSFFFLRATSSLKWANRLPLLPRKCEPGTVRPRCSIVFAARDEGERVEQTIRHLLAQEGIEFEIIPVDDRSRDNT